jgi:AcrR family transcriptional regulator
VNPAIAPLVVSAAAAPPVVPSRVPAAVAPPVVPATVPAAVAPPVVPAAVPAVRKRGRPTAAERRAREAQILATALDVFLHSGFGNSTIDELANAAKVTKRTVYAYFGDKSGLFAAMVKDLAEDVSLDAATDHGTLEALAARIVYRVHSDELVGLHRLVIAESSRFPELARVLYSQGDARHITRLAEHIQAERGNALGALAEPLFSLLLGERHRRRLLGMASAPSLAQAATHADAALAWLGLARR